MKNYDEFIKTSDANWKQIDDTLNQIRGQVKVNGELVPAGGGEIPIFDVQAFKTMYDDVLRKEYAGATANAPEEFLEIYNLQVVVIPTNKKMIRNDLNDQIFRTEKEKYDAITRKIIECNNKGQPVLVGTVSITKSEKIHYSNKHKDKE